MPGWHEATKQLQKEGKLQVVGIIEEQHPDRCRLFMQWKRIDFPVMVDSYNLLEVAAVPITLGIDEYGIVRIAARDPKTIEEQFLNRTYEKPASLEEVIKPNLEKLKTAAKNGGAEAWRNYAQALGLWSADMNEVIDAYARCLELDPHHAPTYFRLGVAYRKRSDSDKRREDDFQNAVKYWAKALELNPNQYIWRRRIQQYGPRLDKPYSFYDWVNQARKEIAARGEMSVPLRVEPGGAEFAYPAKSFEVAATDKKEPDSQGRIERDNTLIQVETTVVPPKVRPGGSVRVHLTLTPNEQKKAHWNNESEPMMIWLNPPTGWQVDSRLLTAPNAPNAVSRERRKVEFEVQCPKDAPTGTTVIPAYALYYVCEDVNGTCLYRRQDVRIQIEVVQK